MKHNKNELDIDFIGGQGSLTKQEEIEISQFIKSAKEKHNNELNKRSTKRQKTTA